jgi:hypothetical protein
MYISNILDDERVRDSISKKVNDANISESLGLAPVSMFSQQKNKLQQVARSEFNSKQIRKSSETDQHSVSAFLPDINKRNNYNSALNQHALTQTNRKSQSKY